MDHFTIIFIVLLFMFHSNCEECDKCETKAKCELFANLNLQQQLAWQQQFNCSSFREEENSKEFGFSPRALADYICCSNTLFDQNFQNSSSGGPQRYNLNNNYRHRNNFDVRNSGINSRYVKSNLPNGNANWIPDNGVNQNYYNNGIGNRHNGNPIYNNLIVPPYGRVLPPNNYFNQNNIPYVTSTPLFRTGRDNFGAAGQDAQCALTRFPPKPETGCCGREASDTDRIIGGKDTEFEQFPWTALLRITFDYGYKRSAFDCGGALISRRHVLTAGHCVFDEEGELTDVEISLSEYDKRTFPRDCKTVVGRGQKCIENVLVGAQSVILHPEYDNSQLSNDIALIRLNGDAPYTDYIRPICLPSINIDTQDFLNLRLAVAGWGRNGPYRTEVKQSTVINLVPHDECQKFYPGLSQRQVCAAGYSGEDTCKGDSGGPLMTVYGGKYEVVGLVSGKRSDSPCGSSVPSLYTNVYYYLNWIYNNIRN